MSGESAIFVLMLAGAALVIGLAVAAIVMAALVIARRRRRAAWHAYFHGGGLIRSLMQRWPRTPRLTDQRDKRFDDPSP